MAVSLPDDLTSAISAAVSDPSSSNLFALGNSVLKKFNESDGKLLFLVLANPDQWNSALTSASSEPTFIGVYASTIQKECGLNPGNPTLQIDSPSITIHEAKKWLHYVVHDRPSMIELLYTTQNHYIAPEWELLRQNVSRIVSTQFVHKVLQIVIGNVANMGHPKFKKNVTRIYTTFYVATRMLDVLESLVRTGRLRLDRQSEEYSQKVLNGDFNLETLTVTAKQRVETLEKLVAENEVLLRDKPDIDFLNSWLLNDIRAPTL